MSSSLTRSFETHNRIRTDCQKRQYEPMPVNCYHAKQRRWKHCFILFFLFVNKANLVHNFS